MNLARDNYPRAARRACARSAASSTRAYWQKIDEARAYPEAFVDALTKAGWMSALIPEEYGGSGLSLTEATVIMEEITRSRRQRRLLPRPDVQHEHAAAARLGASRRRSTCRRSPPASCACSRWASPSPPRAPTPPSIKTVAVKKGDRYVVNGQKVWTSRLQHSELMILLARTTPLDEVEEEVRRHVDLPRRQRKSKGIDGQARSATW